MSTELKELLDALASVSPDDFEPGSFADRAYRALPALLNASEALRDCLDYIETTYDLDDGDETPTCAAFGYAAIGKLDDTPPSAAFLEMLANQEFENFDFGDGVQVLDYGRWVTTDPHDYTRVVYVEYEDDAPDADSHKVSFHVRFGGDGSVSEAYALECDKGQEIGQRGLPMPLFKSKIVIWTEYDPRNLELPDLAREAHDGSAYCARSEATRIANPVADPDWDGTDFFKN